MFAQIMKNQGNIVNLIGGREEGLPIEHKDVFCINIGQRNDVHVGMYYDINLKKFYENTINESVNQSIYRQQAYDTMRYKADQTPLILWKDEALTVNEANKKWLHYSAEGSENANELSVLIVIAKEYIRELYSDNE